MKKIVLTISRGFLVRNILQNDFYRILREQIEDCQLLIRPHYGYKNELRDCLNRYFDDAQLKRDGCRDLKRAFCNPVDGKSGGRLFELVESIA